MLYEDIEFQHELNNFLNYISKLESNDDYILVENIIKRALHENSPMKNEPINCVIWVKSYDVEANDYNPNSVAPPEMLLLETSIEEDGYTQPIVTWKKGLKYEIVDGFHRNRVGKESEVIKKRIMGYLPVTIINNNKTEKGNRMASTIRHNRARGKHSVDVMSDIVLELKNRNWTNSRISKQLGMDEDEILRLCQITGIANLFNDKDFSKAWDIEKSSPDGIDFESKEYIIDETSILDEDEKTITMNTNDPNRVFHTYDKWECYKHNFYGSSKEGMSKEECLYKYAELLRDTDGFAKALEYIINTWKYSCEHYLTNPSMNRIAWLGQAYLAYKENIPSCMSSGFSLLTPQEQDSANNVALNYLNKYLKMKNLNPVDMYTAMAKGRTSILY